MDYSRHRKHWSSSETEEFINDWSDDTTAIGTIIRKYKRPYSALAKRARILGLGQRHEYTEYLTVTVISEEMQVPREVIINCWIRNHGLRYKQSKTSHKNILISQEELLRFLEENKELYNASKISNYLFSEEPKWLKEKRQKDIEWYPHKNKVAWTQSETSKLIRMFKQGKTDEEIGKEVYRSPNFVMYKRQELGLSRSIWNSYEVDILRAYSSIKTIKELSTMLPLRTDKAISMKALKLGLEYHYSQNKCKQ